MNTIQTPKDSTYLPLLKYTGLFGIDVEIVDADTHWAIKYAEELGERVCEAVEVHNEYAMNFPVELQQEMMANAKIAFTAALNNYLDGIAQSFRYDDMKSVRSYTGFDNPYREESIALAQWSADCWLIAGQIEADVVSGTREIPTIEEVVSELPIPPQINKV